MGMLHDVERIFITKTYQNGSLLDCNKRYARVFYSASFQSAEAQIGGDRSDGSATSSGSVAIWIGMVSKTSERTVYSFSPVGNF